MNVILPDGTFNPDEDPLDGLHHCVLNGLGDGVKFYLQKTQDPWTALSDMINVAAYMSNSVMIELLISLGANDWNFGLMGAAEGGNIYLVKFFIAKGADDFDGGVFIAAHGSRRVSNKTKYYNIIKLLWSKGADKNNGLGSAASSNNMDLVHFFIAKGARDWNRGMFGAVQSGNIDIVRFFIEKGANDFYKGMELAYEYNKTHVVDFFRSKLNAINFMQYLGSDVCSICYETADNLIATKCNHVFHRDCINIWINDKRIFCPMCRKNLYR